VSTQQATFAAGCFWGVEETFRQIEGVVSTTVGYIGGTLTNPTYKAVCSGLTGHAESVLVQFDPAKINYEQLLDVFWSSHDPTTLNRQGADVGSQYRSAIFFHNTDQKTAADASIQKLQRDAQFARPIVTEITAASTFYHAEDYHQQYLAKRGRTSCTSTTQH
jgi:peptide-methionine (S)-S-oxide reductase